MKLVGAALVVGTVVVAAVLGTWSSSTPRAATPALRGALTAKEIAWVADYASWFHPTLTAIGDADLALAERSDPRDAEAALRELRSCATRFAEFVPPAPSRELAVARRLVRPLCRHVSTYAAERVRFRETGDAEASRRASVALAQINAIVNETDHELSGLLLINRPLRRLGGVTRTSRIEPRLSRILTELGGFPFPVQVRCWGRAGWRQVIREQEAYTNGEITIDRVGAFVPFVTSVGGNIRVKIQVNSEYCLGAVRLLYQRWRPTRAGDLEDLAFSVALLTHELHHLLVPGSEAEVECSAMQGMSEVATALGASDRFARRLVDLYWKVIYPSVPDEYFSDECREGGALDQEPSFLFP